MFKKLEFELISSIKPADNLYDGYTKPTHEDLSILQALQTTFKDNFKLAQVADNLEVSFEGQTDERRLFTRWTTIYGLMSKIRPDAVGLVTITDLDNNEVTKFHLHGGRATKITEAVPDDAIAEGSEQGPELQK
jgi:hypothetical protein